jgi:hypothetical protein
MSRLGIDRLRDLRLGRRPPEPLANPSAKATPELIEQRELLAARFAELQWDLGGLAYEMARRDHFRLDVLVRRAAALQEIEGELGEAERLLRLEDAAAAGSCRSCGALHGRGAAFCWACGATLVPEAAVNGTTVAPPPPEPPPAGAPASAPEHPMPSPERHPSHAPPSSSA